MVSRWWNLLKLVYPQTFPVALSWGWHWCFLGKYLYSYWKIWKIWKTNIHSVQRMNPNDFWWSSYFCCCATRKSKCLLIQWNISKSKTWISSQFIQTFLLTMVFPLLFLLLCCHEVLYEMSLQLLNEIFGKLWNRQLCPRSSVCLIRLWPITRSTLCSAPISTFYHANTLN